MARDTNRLLAFDTGRFPSIIYPSVRHFNVNIRFFILNAAFVATSSKLAFRLLECREELLFLRRNNAVLLSAEAHEKKKEPPPSLLYFIYRNFFTGTGMFFVLAVMVILGRVEYFLYFYSASFSLFLLYKLKSGWIRIKKSYSL